MSELPKNVSGWVEEVSREQLCWIFGDDAIIIAGWCEHCGRFCALLVGDDDETALCARCDRPLTDVVTVEDVA